MDLEHVRDSLRTFADERDWAQFHSPRNLVLALVGEVGELAELTQWRTDDELHALAATPDGARALGDELADVLSYLVQAADSLGLDLGAAWEAKIEANAAKYPAELARGSNAKYTAYLPGPDGPTAETGTTTSTTPDEQG
ncbi:nucleotide pyrophosphohydrolase [Georgenia sp. Z1344]|uniref:nucleotide pyrophosphohydrolase n=1 Tax=Georgenia sp. Z1344 TaxID=3416706 RepID=UPI003CEAAF83